MKEDSILQPLIVLELNKNTVFNLDEPHDLVPSAKRAVDERYYTTNVFPLFIPDSKSHPFHMSEDTHFQNVHRMVTE